MSKKVLITSLAVLLLSACSSDETEIISRLQFKCEKETIKERSIFVIDCIKSANPKSDEEPEDWITLCNDMAEEIYCEKETVKVKRFKPANGYWRDVEIIRN